MRNKISNGILKILKIFIMFTTHYANKASRRVEDKKPETHSEIWHFPKKKKKKFIEENLVGVGYVPLYKKGMSR